MLKIENIETFGWEAAIRGMRNPMNSWDKSDSQQEMVFDRFYDKMPTGKTIVGEADLDLMRRLFKGGTEHRKFMRMITVYADITAPLYFLKEWDTMKVGTVSNSCSTMHKIAAKEFTLDDFSHEHLTPLSLSCLENTIDMLNNYRADFTLTNMKKDWWQMIQLLPSSYNQRRTVMLNYEVAANIIRQRTGHKLDEWKTMVDTLWELPYMREIMGVE